MDLAHLQATPPIAPLIASVWRQAQSEGPMVGDWVQSRFRDGGPMMKVVSLDPRGHLVVAVEGVHQLIGLSPKMVRPAFAHDLPAVVCDY